MFYPLTAPGNMCTHGTMGVGMAHMARLLMILGVVVFAAGVALHFAARLPFRPGHLPGDIVLGGKHTTFYFPLMTCLLLSLLFSLVSWLLRRR